MLMTETIIYSQMVLSLSLLWHFSLCPPPLCPTHHLNPSLSSFNHSEFVWRVLKRPSVCLIKEGGKKRDNYTLWQEVQKYEETLTKSSCSPCGGDVNVWWLYHIALCLQLMKVIPSFIFWASIMSFHICATLWILYCYVTNFFKF